MQSSTPPATTKGLLYSILGLNILLLAISTALFATRIDVTILVTIVLILPWIPISFLLAVEQLSSPQVSQRPRNIVGSLKKFCKFGCVERPWFLWIFACAAGITTAFQQPICRVGPGPAWRSGFSCRLHRGLVALAILMLAVEFAASFLLKRLKQKVHQVNEPKLSTSWGSESTLGKADAINCPERERERYLQRRNSLSSQRAMNPYYFPSGHSRPSAYRPSTASSRTLRSMSFEMSDRSSSFTSSSASTASRRYCRRPDCPSIPELPKSVDDLLPPLAAPPLVWFPPLRHTPLSADPIIRALSASKIDFTKSNSQPPPSHPPPPPAASITAPAIPHRSPGHSLRPSTSHAGQPSTIYTNTDGIRALRRPPAIKYPVRRGQQRL